MAFLIDWLRRLLDAWRHPGEYPEQRMRRRKLEWLAQLAPPEPYQLTTTKLIEPEQ